MSIYTIVLFLHVSGAIGYFVSIGTWLFGLVSLRRARRVEQVRSLIHLIGLPGPLFGISVLLILVAGLFMTFTAWSLQTSWIAVALVSLVLVAPLGTVLIGVSVANGQKPTLRNHDPLSKRISLLPALRVVVASLVADQSPECSGRIVGL
jgi:hypothetical protein